MKTTIFIVTHAQDSDWVPWLLKSIAKFCTGFHEVVLCIERGQEWPFKKFGLTREKIVLYENPDRIDRYMNHLAAKCDADKYCEGDLICYIDSDCIFTEPTTPETYMKDGKPILLYQSYASLGSSVPWKECTEKALKIPVEYETMRRHPSVYRRDDLEAFRAAFLKLHGKTVYQYLSNWQRYSRPPNNFSEFNAIGYWLFVNRHDNYCWINSETEQYPHNNLIQHWSFGRANGAEARANFQKYGLL